VFADYGEHGDPRGVLRSMGGSAASTVFVVTGLPRSGTSMMMRMLAEGGAPLLVDGVRSADSDNPRGYFELEAVKATARDASWVSNAAGRCVKVISTLLPHLPADRNYRVLLMRRNLDQVVRSQTAMLDRLGTAPDTGTEESARQAQLEHLVWLEGWLASARHMKVLGVSYERVVSQSEKEIPRILQFLELDLDAAAMQRAVEPALQRQR
jgi:hypothetical protein